MTQEGADGWGLRAPLDMPCSPSAPTSPAAFEKCHKAKQRLGPRPPGAPDWALCPPYTALP